MCKDCKNEEGRLRKAEIKLLPKPTIPEKRCCVCKTIKPISEFYRSIAMLDGHQSRCRACRAAGDVLRRLNPERALRMRLHNGYGMTIPDFHAMIDTQQGRCAICAGAFVKPVIDHNHETGAVRALLCNRCNIWLAAIEHPEFSTWAQNYLKTMNQQPVRFRINQRWLEQRKRRKDELKKRRQA